MNKPYLIAGLALVAASPVASAHPDEHRPPVVVVHREGPPARGPVVVHQGPGPAVVVHREPVREPVRGPVVVHERPGVVVHERVGGDVHVVGRGPGPEVHVVGRGPDVHVGGEVHVVGRGPEVVHVGGPEVHVVGRGPEVVHVGGPDVRVVGRGPDVRIGGEVRVGGPDVRVVGPDVRVVGPDVRVGVVGPDVRVVGRVDGPRVWAPHEWRIERPVISGYWRPRGRIGSRVYIHGQNFMPGTVVVWGGEPIPGAIVTGDSISFVVPPGHVDGGIVLRGGGLDADYPVGDFSASADGPVQDGPAEAPDPAQVQEDAARQARAEAYWRERAATIAQDRAAREQAFEDNEAELEATREQRREQRIADMRAKWQTDFLQSPYTEAELTLHEQRVADLSRMARLAESLDDGKLGVRVAVDSDRENARHDQRMAALQASYGAR